MLLLHIFRPSFYPHRFQSHVGGAVNKFGCSSPIVLMGLNICVSRKSKIEKKDEKHLNRHQMKKSRAKSQKVTNKGGVSRPRPTNGRKAHWQVWIFQIFERCYNREATHRPQVSAIGACEPLDLWLPPHPNNGINQINYVSMQPT